MKLLLILLLLWPITGFAECATDLKDCNLEVNILKDITASQQQQLYGMRVSRDSCNNKIERANTGVYVLVGVIWATILGVMIACDKCRQ